MRSETFAWSGVPLAPGGMSGLAWLSGLQLGLHTPPDEQALASAEIVAVEPGRVELICTVPALPAPTSALLLTTAVELVALTLTGADRGETGETRLTREDAARAASGILVVTAIAEGARIDATLVDGQGTMLASSTSRLQPSR
jgi:hypothetical protein